MVEPFSAANCYKNYTVYKKLAMNVSLF